MIPLPKRLHLQSNHLAVPRESRWNGRQWLIDHRFPHAHTEAAVLAIIQTLEGEEPGATPVLVDPSEALDPETQRWQLSGGHGAPMPRVAIQSEQTRKDAIRGCGIRRRREIWGATGAEGVRNQEPRLAPRNGASWRRTRREFVGVEPAEAIDDSFVGFRHTGESKRARERERDANYMIAAKLPNLGGENQTGKRFVCLVFCVFSF